MAAEIIQNKFLTVQRKSLEQVVPNRFVRWFVRWVHRHYGFACRSHVCNNEDGRHKNGTTVNCPNCDTPVVVMCDGTCYASIEYRGIFDSEPDARWAANCAGGSLREVPYNAALPEETVQYGKTDDPMSEISAEYRRGVPLPFVAIPRGEIERLQQGINRTDTLVEQCKEWLQ